MGIWIPRQHFTGRQLAALELPPASKICRCRFKPSIDRDGVRVWPRACRHVRDYAPPGLTQAEWFATFPANFSDWGEALVRDEEIGADYEEPSEPGPPRQSLDRSERVTILATRELKGQCLWNPNDVTDLDGGGALTQGKKNHGGGALVIKGKLR